MYKATKIRDQNGSAMTELGPALLILLVAIFFPLLNLSTIGLTYFCCGTLTDLQANKAALLPASLATSDTGPVKKSVVDAWKATGLGAFANLAQPPITTVSYTMIGTTPYAEVSTQFAANPLMTVPFIPGVPGISAPVQFTFTSKRVVEDPIGLGR